MNTYPNTPEIKNSLCWHFFPEYCLGDTGSAKVTHDHRRGIFIFHD